MSNLSSLASLTSVHAFLASETAVTIVATQPITEFLVGQNNLASSEVDAALVALDGNGLLAGNVDTSLQTPPAPPTPPGRVAYANLVGKGWTVTTDPWDVILMDPSTGLWLLVVDVVGNVGTVTWVGPATADVILADGVGGFWKVVVDTLGNRGTVADAGPATVAPVLNDGTNNFWMLVVDALGNLGSVHVYP